MSGLLWGGRFEAAPDDALLAFASSFDDDRALAPFDVVATAAHVRVLRRAGILDPVEAELLLDALATVSEELAAKRFPPDGAHEDVHSALEQRITELAGAVAGGKLRTGRSRNDQVATALALYVRVVLADIARCAARIADDLLVRAEEELGAGTLLIGTTHGQPAQPILLAFWLHAAAVGIVRRVRAVEAVRRGIDRCPLGAGPVAGSSLPLDREYAATLLDFAGGPTENALDTVGDRDAAVEALFACAALMTQLSRISAEIVAWSAPAFGFVRIGDAAATGSSAMPQKKNPDVFELVRAKTGSLGGLLAGALAQLKGLPLSYQRDLQETKRSAIGGLEETRRAVSALRAAMAAVRFDRERCNRSAAQGFACATDLMERLIRSGIPAREAHAMVGQRIRAAEADGSELRDDSGAPFDARASVAAKATTGSTNPALLAAAVGASRVQIAQILRGLT